MEIVDAVWEKAGPMPGYLTLRVDAWGWTIVRQEYGNTESRYGWEIDHIVPVELGGRDELNNLQPLHWENRRRKEAVHLGLSATPASEAEQANYSE